MNFKKLSKLDCFVWGMIAGMVSLYLVQYSGVISDFWDFIFYQETDVIECDKLYSWYDEAHLTTEWSETDQALFDYASKVCK